MSIKRYVLDGAVGMIPESESYDSNSHLWVRDKDYSEIEKKLTETERYGRQADITIENLERKVEQLAAENAALLKFCKDASFDADYEAELGMERGGFTDALNDIKTPATDAFLAEVRAQGLERLAKAWYAIANETAPGISISESSRLKYRQRADDVADFANEIRKEAK